MLEAMMANGKAISLDRSTPLDIAEKAKHYDMAAFLKGSGFMKRRGYEENKSIGLIPPAGEFRIKLESAITLRT